jgi:hypothetical protein
MQQSIDALQTVMGAQWNFRLQVSFPTPGSAVDRHGNLFIVDTP